MEGFLAYLVLFYIIRRWKDGEKHDGVLACPCHASDA